MKIALVRRDFSRTRGGAENYLINLAEGLVGRRHEVHVFAANYDDLGDDPRFNVHRVPVWRFHSSVRNLTFAENAAKMLRAEQFDIINGLSKIYYQDIYRIGDPLYICWLKLHPWGILDKVLGFANPRDRTILYLEKKIFDRRNHRRIIAISELDKRLVCKYYRRCDPARVKVIYNGVDFGKFSPANRAKYNSEVRARFGISRSADVVLYISMDWKRKGFNHLLTAVSLLPAELRRNVKVLVVGKGEPEKYEKLARELGVEDNIVYTGVQKDIEKFYAAGDVFVLPTLYDPFANVHLEALASGVPVITTSMAGGAEVIEEGLNGYVVKKASDVKDIAAAIGNCLSPRRREGMRAAAPASIASMTWDRHLDQVLKLYEEVFEEKRGNGASATAHSNDR
ncbi:MAG: glycosyltransferase family 4 protein [Planctomycetota bacterium]|jgi:UDP-glucose:(heptosyl)LPS alpha-1,3-glucosyltransferase